jgi:hypothetical protein
MLWQPFSAKSDKSEGSDSLKIDVGNMENDRTPHRLRCLRKQSTGDLRFGNKGRGKEGEWKKKTMV